MTNQLKKIYYIIKFLKNNLNFNKHNNSLYYDICLIFFEKIEIK